MIGVTQQPTKVALPEDDAVGMTVLSQVMHHRYNDVPAKLEPLQIYRVAQMADKYDCTGVLEHIRTPWLDARPYIHDEIPKDLNSPRLADVGALVASAYTLDAATAFDQLTQILVLNYAHSCLSLAKYEWASVLVPSIMCKSVSPIRYRRPDNMPI